MFAVALMFDVALHLAVLPFHVVFHAIGAFADVVGDVTGALYVPPGILRLAFDLIAGPLILKSLIAGPLACLPFDSALDIFHFPFDLVPIHSSSVSGSS